MRFKKPRLLYLFCLKDGETELTIPDVTKGTLDGTSTISEVYDV